MQTSLSSRSWRSLSAKNEANYTSVFAEMSSTLLQNCRTEVWIPCFSHIALLILQNSVFISHLSCRNSIGSHCIMYKILLLTFRAVNNVIPQYHANILHINIPTHAVSKAVTIQLNYFYHLNSIQHHESFSLKLHMVLFSIFNHQIQMQM